MAVFPGVTNINQTGSFLKIVSNDKLEEHRRRVQEAQQEQVGNRFITHLAAYIIDAKEVAVRAKQTSGVESRLLNSIKQYKGEYSSTKLAQIRQFLPNGSEVFMKETGVKCRAATAVLMDAFLPFDGKAWTLEPTPNPEISQEELQSISQQVTFQVIQEELAASGLDRSRLSNEQMASFIQNIQRETFFRRGKEIRDKIDVEVEKIAHDSAKRMAKLIDDQLIEGNWRKALQDFLTDLPIFPAAFLKWELVRVKKLSRVFANGQWVVKPINRVVKMMKHISPFDIYPSQEAKDISDGYLIERVKFTRKFLSDLKGTKGVNSGAVDILLERYQNGGRHEHLHTDQERAEVEDRPNEFSYRNEHIDGWVFTGSVSGMLLAGWGHDFGPVTEADPNPFTEEYEITGMLVDEVVFMAQVNPDPLGQRNYFKASFVEVPGSFWGLGVPDLMKDTQGIANAAARALVNNMAMAAGPMAGVHVDRLVDGEDPDNIHPLRIFQLQNPTGTTAKPIEFFQPSPFAETLIQVIQTMKRLSDDQTGIPAYTHGDTKVSGAGRTASGLNMLMGNQRLLITQTLANIDRTMMRPLIESYYNHNMLFHPDPTIKGDVQIRAQGVLSHIVKDSKLLSIQRFRESLVNPIDASIVGTDGRIKLLNEEARLLGLHNILGTEDEIMRRIQKEQQEAQSQQQELAEMEEAIQDGEFNRDLALQNDEQDHDLEMQDLQHDHEVEIERIRTAAQKLIAEKAAKRQGSSENGGSTQKAKKPSGSQQAKKRGSK